MVRAAEVSGSNPSSLAVHRGTPVVTLYADLGRVVGVSQLTLIEFHSAVASTWRNQEPGCQQYDQAWAERVVVQAMTMVANGRIEVVRLPVRVEEQALALVTAATRGFNNGLKAWDAVHIVTAAAWAYSVGSVVELWTSDKDFGKFMVGFGHFTRFLTVRDLNL